MDQRYEFDAATGNLKSRQDALRNRTRSILIMMAICLTTMLLVIISTVGNGVLAQNPKIRAVTVNASPYAVGFYEKSGFVPLDKEQKANGIRFTPMRKMI